MVAPPGFPPFRGDDFKTSEVPGQTDSRTPFQGQNTDERSKRAGQGAISSSSATFSEAATRGGEKILQQIEAYLKEGADITPLAQVESSTGEPHDICNTGLTEILHHIAFSHPEDEAQHAQLISKLNQLLEKLSQLALEGNQVAQKALASPNNPEESSPFRWQGEILDSGFPRNTPLLFLVKMNNTAGIKPIVSALNKEGLFFQNPRGNTALHIAAITGQLEMAAEMMKRADDLGVLKELMEMINGPGHTAEALLVSLFKPPRTEEEKKLLFKETYEDFWEPLLGGEEMHKALCNQPIDKKKFQFRNDVAERYQALGMKWHKEIHPLRSYYEYYKKEASS